MPVIKTLGFGRPIVVKQTKDAPVIDGRLDDAAWKAADGGRKMVFSNRTKKGVPGLLTTVQLLWDDKNIYIAMLAEDKDIRAQYQKRDDPLFKEEVLEIFLMPQNGEEYFEIQVNAKGALFDAKFDSYRKPKWPQAARRFDSKLKHRVFLDGTLNDDSDIDKSWSAELAIPFSELYGSQEKSFPENGEKWKADFFRFERKGNNKVDFAAAVFNLSKPDFHHHKDWGNIVFSKE